MEDQLKIDKLKECLAKYPKAGVESSALAVEEAVLIKTLLLNEEVNLQYTQQKIKFLETCKNI